jgi:CheY-like chemotaxis protein
MSRILLVDDSPHAQRIGERILSDEGYEVVTVSNADSALIRLEDVDPDVVLADAIMPGRNGYDICQYLKMSPRHKHVRVILTAGVLEPFDEEQMKRVQADASLKKPFEATALLAAVKPLAESAEAARRADAGRVQPQESGVKPRVDAVPFVAVVDAEQVRAAVTIALDASMAGIVEEISARVLAALMAEKPAQPPVQAAHRDSRPEPPVTAEPQAAPPQPAAPMTQPVRKVTPLRMRSGSILGLNIAPAPPEPPREPSGPSKPPRE